MNVKDYMNQVMLPHEDAQVQSGGEGVVRRVLAYSDDAMCVENTFETGAVGALHSHPHTQVTYIVSGRFRFTVGDETYEVKAGDTLVKKNGVIHGCVALEGGVMLDFFTPMREDFTK
ncbi:MAG: cupin domain-containing protein [Clostridia bacterium]|nr:cupin domain-containing protein [Oscillospiraceae bacterium]MBR6747595.1 cupin domain-containing protein [Clostridia bacterium]